MTLRPPARPVGKRRQYADMAEGTGAGVPRHQQTVDRPAGVSGTGDNMEIMTPEHTRWGEFIDRLIGPEGCDFETDPDGVITWQCDRHKKSIAILDAMGVDVAESLAYLAAHGGHCDCEIVFNLSGRDD